MNYLMHKPKSINHIYKKKKLILPINVNPPEKLYTYHAFESAIITSNEYLNECIAEFIVKKSSADGWKQKGYGYRCLQKGAHYFVNSEDRSEPLEFVMYSELDREDCVEIEFRHQLVISKWGEFNILVSDKIENESICDEKNMFKIGHPCLDNIFVKLNGYFYELKESIRAKDSIKLKMKIEDKTIIISSFSNVTGWSELLRDELPNFFVVNQLFVAIQVKYESNQYYDWLYSNYIQMVFEHDDKGNAMIDYFGTPRKNYKYQRAHFLLDYNHYSVETAVSLCDGIINFIIKVLNCHRYIQMSMDHYYLPEALNYSRNHHRHDVLLYGVDQPKRQVYILYYDKNGEIISNKIPIKIVKYSAKEYPASNLIVINYNPDNYPYNLSLQHIKNLLEDYLSGSRSGDKYFEISNDWGNIMELIY